MNYSDTTLKKWLWKVGSLWVVVLLWGFSPTMAATNVAGTTVFVNGHVVATAPARRARELVKHDEVFNEDRIETADNGRAQLRFSDGGLVSLLPNTIFSVEEYFYEDDAYPDSAVFGLLKGGLRTVTGAVGKTNHEAYELKTPVATLGIRGTEYTAVLRPANTLRVHVGRGKVVITNDHGTLEVPEGRNAVARLGQAPEFSEQGPNYAATGPAGDRLDPSMAMGQHPHLLTPELDVVAGAVVVDPALSVNLEDRIAGSYYEYWEVSDVFSLSPENLDTSMASGPNVAGSNSYLEWGHYEGGEITTDSGVISLSEDSQLAYVTGPAVIDYMPSGSLHYSLAGATDVYDSFNASNVELQQFDLGLNLGNATYTLDFALGVDAEQYSASNVTGNLDSGSVSQGFGFSTNNINHSGSNCGGGDCRLDVEGFLAGDQAQAAGVGYRLEDQSNDMRVFTGAAALDRQP